MSKSISEIKHYYDINVFRKLNDFLKGNSRVEFAWQSISELISIRKPKRVLEIGCGIGEICWRLASVLPDTSIVGFDISEKSIDAANKLFSRTNLKFLQADNISGISDYLDSKFDLILLIDVYEHIPLEERDFMNSFIASNLNKNGFVFFSCPTPRNIEFLEKNFPKEIQPIDEKISLYNLIQFSEGSRISLTHYKELSIWREGDYFHCVFTNFLKMQQKHRNEIANNKSQKSIVSIVKSRLFKNNISDMKERENLIIENLGLGIFKQVNNYGS